MKHPKRFTLDQMIDYLISNGSHYPKLWFYTSPARTRAMFYNLYEPRYHKWVELEAAYVSAQQQLELSIKTLELANRYHEAYQSDYHTDMKSNPFETTRKVLAMSK